jgi:hypothetical protein
MRNIFTLLLLTLALGLAGCATTPRPPKEVTAPSAPTAAKTTVSTGKVTLEQGTDTLANAVRRMALQQAGGIVLMHGLGFESIGPISWSNTGFDQATQALAQAAGVMLSPAEGYAFLHPQGYEVLNTWNLGSVLPAELAQRPVSIGLGNGTKLSSAIAFLSRAAGTTVIVDNAVADARTGELWLPSLPLASVLDAVLKSTRVTPESVAVTAEDGVVFIRSRASRTTPRLIGATSPQLGERVNVYLPTPLGADGKFNFNFAATSLDEVKPTIEAQLGVPLSYAGEFGQLPIEQCTFINLSRETVIKYLIAQWPASGIGYRWDGQGITLERFKP